MMAKDSTKHELAEAAQMPLFVPDDSRPAPGTDSPAPTTEASAAKKTRKKVSPRPRIPRDEIRGIQDLIWKESLFALQHVEQFTDASAFLEFLRNHLPQNSAITRDRYAGTVLRWFFADGVRGLAARVWMRYRDLDLAGEMLRYLYLRGEPMVGMTVADALFPIADGAAIPDSYLTNFLRTRFGEDTPPKSIKRVKMNLRRLGILSKEKGNRDTLRALCPSATGFLIVAHHTFAFAETRGVELRTLLENPFWKYLGFKNEDQIRAILKEGLAKSIIAKYVVADRIESISFRYTFDEFLDKGLKL
jgi:hypothetical protein